MVPKRGPFFLGRDRATRVASAPRGLGLYRRAGRDGFFFVKNLAAQAKQYPGKIKPVYVDEQIKRSDGQLVTKQKEAEAYCHRRNAEIQEMLLALAGDRVAYSGADLKGISRQQREGIRTKPVLCRPSEGMKEDISCYAIAFAAIAIHPLIAFIQDQFFRLFKFSDNSQ